MEASQENIGDELLRDENISIDDISENVEIHDDKISISSVEETSKMLVKHWNESLCLRSWVPSSILFQSKPRHLLITLRLQIQRC